MTFLLSILLQRNLLRRHRRNLSGIFWWEERCKKGGSRKRFRFGKKRSGDVGLLKELAPKYGYELIVIEKLQMEHKDVSSTRVRAHLEKGEMEEAARLLGRPYAVIGEVVHGKALGRTIQIPTANQKADKNKLMPPNGRLYFPYLYQRGKRLPLRHH